MNTKKILLSLCLILLVAISVSAISAEDSSDVLEVEDATDAIAIDEDASEVLSADPIQPETNTSDSVQSAVDSAKNVGDIVDLSKYAEYDFADKTVTINNAGITIDGKGTTTIKGYGDGNGIFAIKAENITIQGIKFIDTNPTNNFTYGGNTAGWAISANAAHGGAVKNCEFTDFNSGLVVMQTVGFNIENNKFNGGYSTHLANDPTVNKEKGSKSLNIYRQSANIIVKNNTFEGPILDGVSIAQGSGSNQVIDNTFIGNCYSIYFGGASTKGTTIKNNKFINCGFFKEGDILWEGLPVISIQKASDDISIEDNEFQVINNNVLIAAEKGNEAHGAPTPIGNINITGNTITKYSDDVDVKNVTLFHVLARDTSSLDIQAPLNISNNKLVDGMKAVSIWFDEKEIFSSEGNVLLNDTLDENHIYGGDTLFNTSIEVNDLTMEAGSQGTLKIVLKDSNGIELKNKVLTIAVDGVTTQMSTDDEGVVSLPVTSDVAAVKYVSVIFLGEGNLYKGSMATAKITVNAKQSTAPAAPATVAAKKTTLTVKKATLKVKKAKKIKVTLKSSGKAVAGKTVTIKVNKKTFKAKTNKKGVATIKVKVNKKGKFTATVKFAGDKAYKAVTKKVKFTVKK